MLKKNLSFTLLFALIAALSVWAIAATSNSFSFSSLWYAVTHAKLIWIIAALVLMPGFIVFEGLALAELTEGIFGQKSAARGIVYSAADIYFSAITPSASGGQPASAFFMRNDGIPTAKITVILIINLILYCYSLLFSGLLAIPLGGGLFFSMELFAQILVAVGFLLITGLSVIFWLLLRRESIIRSIVDFAIRAGEKLGLVKRGEVYRERLACVISQYASCSHEIRGRSRFIWKALVYNVLQRLCQSLITVFCYLAIGGRWSNVCKVWSVQLMANLGAYAIPIPGGMGVSDYLMISGFERVGDAINDTTVTLISRAVSFYCGVLLSLVILAWAYFGNERLRKAERVR